MSSGFGASPARRPPIEGIAAELAEQVGGIWPKLMPPAGRAGVVRTLFTAVESGAGTTTLASATAYDLAVNLRVRVLLVEAHLKRPAMARLFGLPPAPGLSDLFDGRAELPRCLHEVPGVPELRVLPGGSARPPVRGELSTPLARQTFAQLAEQVDYLIVDGPPLLGGPEGRLLLDQVDSAVLVLRARSTRRDGAKRAVSTLAEAGVDLVGAVLNRYQPELSFL